MGLFGRKKQRTTESYEGVQMITVATPNSVNTEQFNTIRTNIQFASVDQEFKSIVVTASMASEGKSTVAANLAVSFARQGQKVLLVDADLRRPMVERTFGLENAQGLTNFLIDRSVNVNDIIYETNVDNLFVMPSGPIPPNPSELVGSQRMSKLIEALGAQLDLVIYDAPPVLPVTDAQLIASKVDGTVLVVREGQTEKEAIKRTVIALKHVGAKIIGFVLNDVKESDAGYYGMYYKK